ncbi:hypothetical protein EG68_08164 [Paragonimus skrjabini miyazakii]|uniref:Uncharacterized protein n=1 Tax=Paragonimus skrjabini miyazakii TaxID=59628 RepID=A0A8S9YPN1_9TREM|nr:hypothetical protein EG68_08164 [Paragonimus skrjabini miyazakii]
MDDIVDGELLQLWNRWLGALSHFGRILIPRRIGPEEVDVQAGTHSYVLSDASEVGCGTIAYPLLTNPQRVRCYIIMTKARVAPLCMTSVPGLGLAAAVLTVKLSNQVRSELNVTISSITLYSTVFAM